MRIVQKNAMSEKKLLMIRISEIAVKGPKTRRKFLLSLVSHIKYVFNLYGINDFEIKKTYSRINVLVPNKIVTKAKNILANLIPGVASVSEVIKTKTQKEEIFDAVEEHFLKEIEQHDTFAVKVRRTGQHNFTSVELASMIGSFILERVKSDKLKVNLTRPDYVLNVDVQQDETFLFTSKSQGLGGLPAETQGKVLIMISGKKEDLSNIVELYIRGATTYILLLNNKVNEEFKRTIEKIVKLQPNLKRSNVAPIVKEREDVPRILIEHYERNNCLALCMTKEHFFKYEKNIPVEIPIFVPDIVKKIEESKLQRFLSTL